MVLVAERTFLVGFDYIWSVAMVDEKLFLGVMS